MSDVVIWRPSDTMSAEDLKSLAERALQNERERAHARAERFIRECEHFERTYAMTTDAFLEAFESGTIGDDEDFFDWYAAAQGKHSWTQRSRQLDEVTVETN